ncbi:hypothetical protein ACSMX9_22675 [Streptomyces sp. LE64]|uniref:hypothetical protein n=1 Tax=Streptomyces sp. LE64 TaxID=3448653 RepID=UPI0040418046
MSSRARRRRTAAQRTAAVQARRASTAVLLARLARGTVPTAAEVTALTAAVHAEQQERDRYAEQSTAHQRAARRADERTAAAEQAIREAEADQDRSLRGPRADLHVVDEVSAVPVVTARYLSPAGEPLRGQVTVTVPLDPAGRIAVPLRQQAIADDTVSDRIAQLRDQTTEAIAAGIETLTRRARRAERQRDVWVRAAHQAQAESDRYNLAWQSARLRASIHAETAAEAQVRCPRHPFMQTLTGGVCVYCLHAPRWTGPARTGVGPTADALQAHAAALVQPGPAPDDADTAPAGPHCQ